MLSLTKAKESIKFEPNMLKESRTLQRQGKIYKKKKRMDVQKINQQRKPREREDTTQVLYYPLRVLTGRGLEGSSRKTGVNILLSCLSSPSSTDSISTPVFGATPRQDSDLENGYLKRVPTSRRLDRRLGCPANGTNTGRQGVY
jgi:hypothetical protein